VRSSDYCFASLDAPPEQHILLDALGIIGYGSMDVAEWLRPHEDQFPVIRLPEGFEPLHRIWPEILMEEEDGNGTTSEEEEAANRIDEQQNPDTDQLPEQRHPDTQPTIARNQRKSRNRKRTVPQDPLDQLWRDVVNSTDRLFFIKYTPQDHVLPKWYLVNVDLTQCNTCVAKTRGVYRLQWWIKQPSEKDLPNTAAAWIPEVHDVLRNNTFGKYLGGPIDRIWKKIQNPHFGRYELDCCLADCRLFGPFNFTGKWNTGMEIAETVWNSFEEILQNEPWWTA